MQFDITCSSYHFPFLMYLEHTLVEGLSTTTGAQILINANGISVPLMNMSLNEVVQDALIILTLRLQKEMRTLKWMHGKTRVRIQIKICRR